MPDIPMTEAVRNFDPVLDVVEHRGEHFRSGAMVELLPSSDRSAVAVALPRSVSYVGSDPIPTGSTTYSKNEPPPAGPLAGRS